MLKTLGSGTEKERTSFLSQSSSLMPGLSVPQLNIDDVETDFALRNFESALSKANDILRDHEALASTHLDDTRYESVSEITLPLIKYGYLKDKLSSINSSYAKAFTVGITVDAKVHEITNRSIIERAAAVAIQSTYELWRKRNTQNIDEELCLHLEPFLEMYTKNESTPQDRIEAPGFEDVPILMSIELLTIYTNFCHALGLIQASILSSLQFFTVLLNASKAPDFDKEFLNEEYAGEGTDEKMYNYCFEVLNLILIKTIPFLEEKRAVESITDCIFTIIRNRSFGNSRNNFDQVLGAMENVHSAPHINESSVEIMRRNIEAIIVCEEKTLPDFVMDAMQDVLDDVKDINTTKNQDRSVEEHPNTSSEAIRSKVQHATSRLEQDWSQIHQLEQHESSIDEKDGDASIKNQIVEFLWTSENRWQNRGKVIATGYLTYSLWKRRKRIGKSAKSITSSLISPIQEIANAFKSPRK
ncbi:predicted protein [Chaetoceros tenuissimus]|uniref:Uncharacterized protein n=1 Tax=Chaetoceros tenuissimus TaxID=426638 RepID=A0AAD3D022_9STRA|nr:predicted protein [Chaetoceros tenuissimus]